MLQIPREIGISLRSKASCRNQRSNEKKKKKEREREKIEMEKAESRVEPP